MLGLLGAMVFRFFPPTPPGSTTLVPTCAHVHLHVQNAKTHANIILTNPTDLSLPLLFLPLFFLPPLARAHVRACSRCPSLSLAVSFSRSLFLSRSLSARLLSLARTFHRSAFHSCTLSLSRARVLSLRLSLARTLSRARVLSLQENYMHHAGSCLKKLAQ